MEVMKETASSPGSFSFVKNDALLNEAQDHRPLQGNALKGEISAMPPGQPSLLAGQGTNSVSGGSSPAGRGSNNSVTPASRSAGQEIDYVSPVPSSPGQETDSPASFSANAGTKSVPSASPSASAGTESVPPDSASTAGTDFVTPVSASASRRTLSASPASPSALGQRKEKQRGPGKESSAEDRPAEDRPAENRPAEDRHAKDRPAQYRPEGSMPKHQDDKLPASSKIKIKSPHIPEKPSVQPSKELPPKPQPHRPRILGESSGQTSPKSRHGDGSPSHGGPKPNDGHQKYVGRLHKKPLGTADHKATRHHERSPRAGLSKEQPVLQEFPFKPPLEHEIHRPEGLQSPVGSSSIQGTPTPARYSDKIPATDFPSRGLCFATLFLVLLFVVITIPIYVLVTQLRKMPSSVRLPDDASLYYGEKACSSKICKQIKAFLLDSANKNADPCQDFYAYVCGRWTGKIKDTLNHDEDFFADYIIKIHSKLEEGPVVGLATRAERAMTSAYKSCLEFMKREDFNLSKITGMLKLDPKTWTKFKSSEDVVLQFMVLSFMHGLNLLVRFELSDGVISMLTGQTLTALFGLKTREVINWTLHDLGESDASLIRGVVVVEETLNAMAKRLKNGTSEGSPVSRMPAQWKETLLGEFRKSTAETIVSSEIRMDKADTFFFMLNALYKEPLAVVQLYTLVCLVGHFAKLKHDRQRLFKESAHDVQLYCLKAVGSTFPGVLPEWITKNLQHPNASTEAERMSLIIIDIATSKSSSAWRFQLQYDDIAPLQFHVFGSKNLVSYVSEDVPDVKKDDFVEMTTWAMRNANKRSVASTLPQWRWQLSNRTLLRKNRIVVPTSCLGEQFLQLDTEELSINYGTLGVQFASSLLRWAIEGGRHGPLLSRKGPELTRVGLCVDDIDSQLGLNMTAVEKTKSAVALWAVRVAHEYIETGDKDAEGVQSWLFFMRLCRSLCWKKGETARWSRVACNLATLASAGFDRAFNCSRERPSSCN